MKKKVVILLTSIMITLVLSAGIVYALFKDSASSGMSISFGSLEVTQGIVKTGTATFAKPGDTRTFSITVGSNLTTSTAPFGYEISVVQSAGNDASFASSILAYWDGELVGTLASAFPAGASFDGTTFVASPDRILMANNATTAVHELKLEYNLGAASVHNAKKVGIDVAVRASTLEVSEAALVSSEEEFAQIMYLAQKSDGGLISGFNVILSADIALTRNYTTAKALVVNLNGHNLSGNGSLTFSGVGESRVTSYRDYDGTTVKRATVAPNIVVNGNAAGWVNVSENVAVGTSAAPSKFSAAQVFSSDAVVAALKASADKATLRGDTANLFLGNGAYIGAGVSATSDDAALATVSDGGKITVAATQHSSNVLLHLTAGAQTDTVLLKIVGTDTASAVKSTLDTLMNAQLGVSGALRQVTFNLLLPKTARFDTVHYAEITWWSSAPSVISTNGKFIPTDKADTVDLIARIRVNNALTTAQYTANVESKKDAQDVLDDILALYGDLRFGAIGEKHFLPSDLTQDYTGLPQEEEQKMTEIKRLISNSGMTAFTFDSTYFKDIPPTLSYAKWMDDSVTLSNPSSIHSGTISIEAYAEGMPCAGIIDVYIDVASAQEAVRYLNALAPMRTDIADNIFKDAFHNVYNETGAQYDGAMPQEGVTALHNNPSIINGFTARDGSFVLPNEFSNQSSLTDTADKGAGKNIYFRYFYQLVAISSGASIFDNGTNYEHVIRQGSSFDVEVAGLVNAPSEFNNFFLVNPSNLIANDVTVSIKYGVYVKSGDQYQRQSEVGVLSIRLPGAIQMTDKGFTEPAVFDAVMNGVRASAFNTQASGSPTMIICQGAARAILNDHAAMVTSLSLISGTAGTLQVTGSFNGISEFKNLTELTLSGNSTTPFFASDAAIASMTDAASQLTNLTRLSLQYCNMSSLEFVKLFSNLKLFDCCHNPNIKDISPILASAGTLREVNVGYTGLVFDRLLSSASSQSAANVLDMLYHKYYYTHTETPDIRYTFGADNSEAVYNGGARLTAAQMQAMDVLLRLDIADATAGDRYYVLAKDPFGLERITYSVVSGNYVFKKAVSEGYTPDIALSTLSGGIWSANNFGATDKLFFGTSIAATPASPEKVVIKIVAITLPEVSGGYYSRNFEVSFTAKA